MTELRVRVQELEARALWLARRLVKAERALKVPVPAKPKAKPKPRCPGCFFEVPKGQRSKTCVYCGFDFRAVKPFRS